MPSAVSVSRQQQPRGFARLWRVLKQLFHEFIGAAFAVLAFGWLSSAFRAWTRDLAHWLVALSIGVALLFLAFSFTSFRRARML
jgi:hypothetical protein